jgi:hypothetical protein
MIVFPTKSIPRPEFVSTFVPALLTMVFSSGRRLLGFISALLASVVLSLVFGASSAAAHSAANSPASNYRTKLLTVEPVSDAYEVAVIETGIRFSLRWKSGPELIVPDYDGYPYLRIGPKGVEENQQSNAKYLNSSRFGSDTIPDGLKPEGPPEWKRISTESVGRWHDHRIHWMSSELPESVVAEPGKSHILPTAPIVFTAGPTTVTATTEMRWTPGPSATPYWALAALLALIAIGSALWARNNLNRRRIAVRIVCALCAVLVVADVVHLVGISFGVAGPLGEGLGRMVSVGFVSLAAWVIALLGITLALRNRLDAPYLLTFSAALMAVVGGFADLGVLSKSSLPVAFGDGGPALVRILVAATLGLGLGVAMAGVMLTTPIRVLNDAPGGERLPGADYPDVQTGSVTEPATPKATAKGWELD